MCGWVVGMVGDGGMYVCVCLGGGGNYVLYND